MDESITLYGKINIESPQNKRFLIKFKYIDKRILESIFLNSHKISFFITEIVKCYTNKIQYIV